MRIERFEFDAAYIERLVSGEPETERHFTEYFGRLLSVKLRSRLRTATQVEDAKQETFVRVLTALKEKGGIQAAGSLGAYVNSVCNFVLFEMYRGGARTTPLGDEYDEMDTREGSESNLIAGEEREKVREALATLPQRDKDLLMWLFFDERNKDEICRELGIDRDYLRVLLHRAKNQFRAKFAEMSR